MISVVIPVLNAGSYIPALIDALALQTLNHELIIIDSGSTDDTQVQLQKRHIKFTTIPRASFNHGATRNLGISLSQYESVVFLTQDALPANSKTLEVLVGALESSQDIAVAYGRQLPYPDADLMSQFARLSNYPDKSRVRSLDDIPSMGIKTCHCSNSFAAYRKADLLRVGGFPTDTILGEDVTVTAHLMLHGKQIAYCAEAAVYHSHNYTLTEEFKRYFDIGAFHEQQKEVLAPFNKAESEGLKYVLNEWKYLKAKNRYDLIPVQLIRVIAKYTGYKFGYWHTWLPTQFKRKLSMHKSFW